VRGCRESDPAPRWPVVPGAGADLHQDEAARFGHSGGMSDLETIIQKLVRQELQEQMPGIIAHALADDRRARGEVVHTPVDTRALLAVQDAAVVTGRHPVTLRRALKAGELHGHQLRKRGRWTLERQCLLAWMNGDPCVHKHKVSPLRPQRRRG
jgi:hypothetical protein